jgi:hypothetical protein
MSQPTDRPPRTLRQCEQELAKLRLAHRSAQTLFTDRVA